MLRGQNGITLVALVVTIIVLIILAGVSISLVFSETGIINRAQEAGASQANAQVYEDEVITNASVYTNDVLKSIYGE